MKSNYLEKKKVMRLNSALSPYKYSSGNLIVNSFWQSEKFLMQDGGLLLLYCLLYIVLSVFQKNCWSQYCRCKMEIAIAIAVAVLSFVFCAFSFSEKLLILSFSKALYCLAELPFSEADFFLLCPALMFYLNLPPFSQCLISCVSPPCCTNRAGWSEHSISS